MFGPALWIVAVQAAAEIPPAPAEAPAIVVEGSRQVCRYITETGSILGKNVCKTKDQWDKESAASRALVDQRAREQTILIQSMIRSR